jgi:anthranilate phosphoribosyltransferase
MTSKAILTTGSTPQPALNIGTFKPLLSRIVQTPEFFTPIDLRRALEHIFETIPSDPSKSILPDAQIAAFLTALHINRLERRPEFLAAAAALLRERAVTLNVEGRLDGSPVVDIVGTGGDGHNLFNVSTAAAMVAAGCGARVIKVSPPICSLEFIFYIYLARF